MARVKQSDAKIECTRRRLMVAGRVDNKPVALGAAAQAQVENIPGLLAEARASNGCPCERLIPGTPVLRDPMDYTRAEQVFPRAAFMRVVKEVVNEMAINVGFTREALRLTQAAAEKYMLSTDQEVEL